MNGTTDADVERAELVRRAANEQAERERQATVAALLARNAEQKAAEDMVAKHQAENREHRAKVHREAAEDFAEALAGDRDPAIMMDAALALVKMIVRDKIRHIMIEY